MSRSYSVTVASALLALASMTASARADGMGGSIKDAPPAPEVYQWDGLSIGVGIGAGRVGTSVSVDANKTSTFSKCKKKILVEPPKDIIKCQKLDIYNLQHQYQSCQNGYTRIFESGWKCRRLLEKNPDSQNRCENHYNPIVVGHTDPTYRDGECETLGEGDWESYDPSHKYASADFNDDEWHWFGTLQVGYDRLLNNRILIGAFADIDFYIDGDRSSSTYSNGALISSNFNLDNVWSVGGKVGLLVSPRLAFYAVGGYSEARVDGSITADFYGKSVTAELDDKMRGWFIGGGGELKLQRNVSLRLEYRYTRFDDESISASNPFSHSWEDCHKYYNVSGEVGLNANYDMDIHSVRAALVIKLGDVHDSPVESLK